MKRTDRSGEAGVDNFATVRLPTAELFGQLFTGIGGLLHSRLTLAEHEMGGKIKSVGMAVAIAAAAVVAALLGSVAALITAIALLRLVAPLWAAALIVMALAFALAGVLALVAQSIVKKQQPLVPQRTVASLREDLAWAKTLLSSNSA